MLVLYEGMIEFRVKIRRYHSFFFTNAAREQDVVNVIAGSEDNLVFVIYRCGIQLRDWSLGQLPNFNHSSGRMHARICRPIHRFVLVLVSEV